MNMIKMSADDKRYLMIPAEFIQLLNQNAPLKETESFLPAGVEVRTESRFDLQAASSVFIHREKDVYRRRKNHSWAVHPPWGSAPPDGGTHSL